MTFAGLFIMASGLFLMTLAGVPVVQRRIRDGIFYGRWLVGLSALVMILGIVPLFHGMTAWFVVLEQHFQWNRTQLSLAFSLARVEGGIMGPIEGLLVDRLGPRRIVLIGLMQ